MNESLPSSGGISQLFTSVGMFTALEEAFFKHSTPQVIALLSTLQMIYTYVSGSKLNFYPLTTIEIQYKNIINLILLLKN